MSSASESWRARLQKQSPDKPAATAVGPGGPLQVYSELPLLVSQKMFSKKWWNSHFHFSVHVQPYDSTFDSCVATILPLATEVTHISLRWPDETPFGSHPSNWEPCHSPSKSWHHRVWGRRCSWSSWKVISSYTRLSEIIAWDENGFSPILIHVETQGAASEGQKIERKKKYFWWLFFFFLFSLLFYCI